MGFQREVRIGFRSQNEIEREACGERVDALLSELAAEIERMKELQHGKYRSVDLHALEEKLRRLADHAETLI